MTWPAEALARIASLEAELEAERERAKWLEVEREKLRAAYRELQIEHELLRRRIFAAKAERLDTSQLELEFAERKKELEALAAKLGLETDSDDQSDAAAGSKPKRKPKGRRNLLALLAGEKIYATEPLEVPDPEMEALVAAGLAQRAGSDDSARIKWRRGCAVLVVTRCIKYRLAKEIAGVDASSETTMPVSEVAIDAASADSPPADTAPTASSEAPTDSSAPEAITPPEATSPAPAPEIAAASAPIHDASASEAARAPLEEGSVAPRRTGPTTLVTAKMPPSIIERSMGTPSLFAHIGASKFHRGLPLLRQEEQFLAEGLPIGRDVMCRWLEEIGGTMGATVIHAMRTEALATAFCILTDGTHVLVQPIRTREKKRQACKRGHFVVQIADRDHVFFEYTASETSASALEMFRGFSGYVQADANSVHDILFRDHRKDPPEDVEPDFATRSEVGCWSHGRTKFWEAAVAAKEPLAREALFRIGRLFANERKWKEMDPLQRKAMRDRFSRPEILLFFEWVEAHWPEVEPRRGLVRSALGYARNQKDALMRFLEDGRLEMTNNRSERENRRIATGRKAWLFVGSDDHASSTASWFTMIASAKLHGLDPEDYLRDLLRVLPQWPKDRYLELAPKYWRATKARLVPAELDREIGWLTIPAPLDAVRSAP